LTFDDLELLLSILFDSVGLRLFLFFLNDFAEAIKF